MWKYVSVAAMTIALAGGAQAATVFEDEFNYGTDLIIKNVTGAGLGGNWSIDVGKVDYISGPITNSRGDVFDLCAGTGGCIDLDGSWDSAKVYGYSSSSISTVQTFAAGIYDIFFTIFGTKRGQDATVTISFGGVTQTTTIGENDTLTEADFGDAFKGVVVGAGGAKLSFGNEGGDGKGAILTSAAVVTPDAAPASASAPSPVPLPASVLLLGAGLGLLGAMRRKAA
jgi:hypothetical protein